MKQRAMTAICGVILAAGLLTGCGGVVESVIVKPKDASSLGNYEEGEMLKTSEDISADEETGDGASVNDDDLTLGDSESDEDAAAVNGASEDDDGPVESQNALRALLGAPEHYQSETSDTTGNIQVLTDAVVEIPDADKVSAISVSQHTFDQSVMDLITETFFPDAVIYSGDSYYQETKEDCLEKLETLKAYAAEGNLDPYNAGTDADGNYRYNIYAEIDYLEAAYEAAPESRTLVEVHPQYGLEVDDGSGGTTVRDNSFFGIAVMPGGAEYTYLMKTYNGMPMEVSIRKNPTLQDTSSQSNKLWYEYESMEPDNPEKPTEEEVIEAAGVSLEEAKAIADEKVEMLNLEHMELDCWEYGISYIPEHGFEFTKERWEDTGYIFHYTRNLGGLPITYTTDSGGSLEDMDSDMETWGYEILDITVTKDGIDTVWFCNEYDIGETQTENMELLSFDEVMDIYEKMMLVQGEYVLSYSDFITYRIDRITFGYGRIYDPSSSSITGLLVPVWDFFGSFDISMNYGEGHQAYTNDVQYQSYLTINGADGSIIDRKLGY